jgi:hypothetical protein
LVKSEPFFLTSQKGEEGFEMTNSFSTDVTLCIS